MGTSAYPHTPGHRQPMSSRPSPACHPLGTCCQPWTPFSRARPSWTLLSQHGHLPEGQTSSSVTATEHPRACRQRGAPAQREHPGSRKRLGVGRSQEQTPELPGCLGSPCGLDQDPPEEGRISRLSGVLGRYTWGFQGRPHPPEPLSAGQAQPPHCTTLTLH